MDQHGGTAMDASLIASCKIGPYNVFSLSEGPGMWPGDLLLGATWEQKAACLPDGAFLATTNAFLVRGPGVNILADAGYGTDLPEQLDALEVAPERIDAVLITHMHVDHIGGLLRDGAPAFLNALLCVSAPEAAYWDDAEAMRLLPESERENFLRAQQVLRAYGDRVRLFRPGPPEAPFSGLLPEIPDIRAIAAYGHTPGHTLFLIGSGGGQLLLWGDLICAMAIQMPCPEVALTFDHDRGASVSARLRILRYASERNMLVGGSHIPWPGMGRVAADPAAAGGYLFTPVPLH
jgi:glyoxylase-like metal-dependent hydrolase (beta-lactamase superfamily II)